MTKKALQLLLLVLCLFYAISVYRVKAKAPPPVEVVADVNELSKNMIEMEQQLYRQELKARVLLKEVKK